MSDERAEQRMGGHQGYRLWGGRFAGEGRRESERGISFGASIGFDFRLVREDIAASMAHARALAAAGVITGEECARMLAGLEAVRLEAARLEAVRLEPARPEAVRLGPASAAGRTACTDVSAVPSADYEDVHTWVEARLAAAIGPLAGKLRTARSRNDQVATDEKLWLKHALGEVRTALCGLMRVVVDVAERERDTLMPGYTHLQAAQPVVLGHHLLAYFEMFRRDVARADDCLARADVCPLGAAALAGTGFAIDPGTTARDLGFAEAFRNSMDAVSDRDFLLEALACLAIIMVHLSRLCEELVVWSSAEFGFVRLAPGYATGSSIMPQKRNPDAAELVRGKTGRVIGDLVGLLVVMKGLPLCYNKDMQEDKPLAFDAFDTVVSCLEVVSGVLETLTVDRDRMADRAGRGFGVATDAADFLVRGGMAFRDAHEAVGRAVGLAESSGRDLAGITRDEWKSICPMTASEGFDWAGFAGVLTPDGAAGRRASPGGTAPGEVARRIREARVELDAILARGVAAE